MPMMFMEAKPIETSPMWLTDEKPMTYLKSRCRKAMNAPYTTLIKVSKMIQGRCTRAPSGRNCTPTRSAAYAPSFINTPAWIMDTAVGAATWPSGLQLWNGNRPASTPKPMNTKGNQKRAMLTPPNWLARSKGPGCPVNCQPARGRLEVVEVEAVSRGLRVVEHLRTAQHLQVGWLGEERPRREVHNQQPDQRHHRADQNIQCQLHGGVFARHRPAPGSDQQVH